MVKGLFWGSHPDHPLQRGAEPQPRRVVNASRRGGVPRRTGAAGGGHHQKLFVVLHPGAPERDVAFVGGIDLCHGRNDDEHHHGDPQAIEIDQRFGPTPAWHDMQVEIRGAAVGDIVETFSERWNDPNPLQRGLPRASSSVRCAIDD